jgi:hypothetical protein
MELFTKLFSDLLVFVYHCFDRIVIPSPRRAPMPPGCPWQAESVLRSPAQSLGSCCDSGKWPLRAAPRTLRAQPFPAPPAEIAGPQVNLTVPIRFNLR